MGKKDPYSETVSLFSPTPFIFHVISYLDPPFVGVETKTDAKIFKRTWLLR